MNILLDKKISCFEKNNIRISVGDILQLKHEVYSHPNFFIEGEKSIEQLSEFSFSNIFLFEKDATQNHISIIRPASGLFIDSKFAIDAIYEFGNQHYAVANQLLIDLNNAFKNKEIEVTAELTTDNLVQIRKDSQLISELYDLIEIEQLNLFSNEDILKTKTRYYLIHLQKKWRVGKLKMFNSNFPSSQSS